MSQQGLRLMIVGTSCALQACSAHARPQSLVSAVEQAAYPIQEQADTRRVHEGIITYDYVAWDERGVVVTELRTTGDAVAHEAIVLSRDTAQFRLGIANHGMVVTSVAFSRSGGLYDATVQLPDSLWTIPAEGVGVLLAALPLGMGSYWRVPLFDEASRRVIHGTIRVMGVESIRIGSGEEVETLRVTVDGGSSGTSTYWVTLGERRWIVAMERPRFRVRLLARAVPALRCGAPECDLLSPATVIP